MSSGFGGDAVGHADGAAAAVIAAGSQPAGGEAEVCVDGNSVEEVELGEVQSRRFFVRSGQAHEVVEDLGDTDRREACGTGGEQGPYFCCGRLSPQVGDDGVGVEDRHRFRDASALRASRRAASELGPRPWYFPSRSATG